MEDRDSQIRRIASLLTHTYKNVPREKAIDILLKMSRKQRLRLARKALEKHLYEKQSSSQA